MDPITLRLEELRATYRTRKIDTEQTFAWARVTYRLSRAIEIAGRLSDSRFLLDCGLSRDQIRQTRLFAERFPDTQTLEGLLEWMRQYSDRHAGADQRPRGTTRQLSRMDVIYELACTGKPADCPRWEGAHWQEVGHWGADKNIYYGLGPGPAG